MLKEGYLHVMESVMIALFCLLSIIIKDKSMKSESDSNTQSSTRMEHPFMPRPDGLMCLPAQHRECGGVPRRQATAAGEEDRCIRITRVI